MDQIIDEIEISTTRKWFSKFIHVTPQIQEILYSRARIWWFAVIQGVKLWKINHKCSQRGWKFAKYYNNKRIYFKNHKKDENAIVLSQYVEPVPTVLVENRDVGLIISILALGTVLTVKYSPTLLAQIRF